MEVKIEPSWKKALEKEFNEEYFVKLTEFVKKEYQQDTVYPPAKFIFNAFELTPFDKVEVIILGQDPYHEPGQANGLAFAVGQNTSLPPSLQNIYKEIAILDHPFPNEEIKLMIKLNTEKTLSKEDFETIQKLLHKYLNLRADVFFDD